MTMIMTMITTPIVVRYVARYFSFYLVAENEVKMIQKVAMSGDIQIVRDVARYFSFLSCCDKAKDFIIQNGFFKILSIYL